MLTYSIVDVLPIGFFILEWTVYAVTLERTAYGRRQPVGPHEVYREVWMRRMLEREARMVDMQIMASLQNGTAFFASTTLLAHRRRAGAVARHQRSACRSSKRCRSASPPPPALWELNASG